jgi:hypothetical protein
MIMIIIHAIPVYRKFALIPYSTSFLQAVGVRGTYGRFKFLLGWKRGCPAEKGGAGLRPLFSSCGTLVPAGTPGQGMNTVEDVGMTYIE